MRSERPVPGTFLYFEKSLYEVNKSKWLALWIQYILVVLNLNIQQKQTV